MAESKGFIPDVYMNTLGNSKKPWENVYAKGITTLIRKHVYKVGEIAFHAGLPTWAYLECVKSGLTGESVPTEISKEVNMNDVIRDNVAEWEVRKIGGNSLEGLGLLPTITVTSIPDAIITVQIDGTKQSKTVGADGVVTFNAYKLGIHTVSGTHKGIASMNTEKVDVQTIAKYNTTISFFSATLNVTVESGATITVTDGNFVTKKTSTGSAIPFTIYNKGVNVKAVAEKNNVNSNIQSFTFSTNGESKAVTLKFVKLTVTEEVGTAITVSRNSYTYSATIGSSGSAVFYLPEIGTWSIVGIKGDITRNDTIAITEYNNYSFSFFSATLNVTVESGAVITLTDGTTTATKTSTGSAIAFTVRNKSVSVYATKSGIRSNTQTVTFVNKGESKSVTLNFIKLTVTSKEGATVRVSKGSYSYSVVIGASKTNVFYLPEVGTWTATYTKGTSTRTKTVATSAYTGYSLKIGSTIYGMRIDGTKSAPEQMITYLADCDNANFTPAHMNYSTDKFDYGSWKNAFFMPRPCMLKYNGTVDYYLNPNDYTKKADGTASDVANTNYGGNAMIEWGDGENQIWVKVVPDNGTADTSCRIYISDSQEDENYHAWSFINNQGKLVKHFYTPIYNGSYISSKMRSLSGQACGANQDATTEINFAKANNQTADVLWYTEVYADITLINMLLMLIGRNMDTQAVFGEGITGASSAVATGTLNTKGMFYGKATATSRTTAVKVFGMENWWGNIWRRYAGHVTNRNGKDCYKLTWGKEDGTAVVGYNTNGNGYKVTNNSAPGSQYVTQTEYATDCSMCAKAGGGSATTYYCDYHWHLSNCYALRGGCWNDGSNCGAFFVRLSRSASYSSSDFGCALSCKPLN